MLKRAEWAFTNHPYRFVPETDHRMSPEEVDVIDLQALIIDPDRLSDELCAQLKLVEFDESFERKPDKRRLAVLQPEVQQGMNYAGAELPRFTGA